MRICKFEVDQWFNAFGLDIQKYRVSDEAIECVEGVIEAIVCAESEEVGNSMQCGDV